MFFFLMGQNFWYYYQGASPAPMCIDIDKETYELGVTSEPSVGGGVHKLGNQLKCNTCNLLICEC